MRCLTCVLLLVLGCGSPVDKGAPRPKEFTAGELLEDCEQRQYADQQNERLVPGEQGCHVCDEERTACVMCERGSPCDDGYWRYEAGEVEYIHDAVRDGIRDCEDVPTYVTTECEDVLEEE